MAVDRPDNPRCLIPEERLDARVKELAKEIEEFYQGKDPLVAVCVLKSSFVFFSDLIRQIDLPMTCEFLGLSSYGKSFRSSGEAKLTLDLAGPIAGRHVLLVEDIVNTGSTLQFLQQGLKARRPASLRTCSLLLKPHAIRRNVEVDYVGFQVGDEFVVGYGNDYEERYRGLSYNGAVERQL